MKSAILSVSLIFITALQGLCQERQEFNGPFISWANIKTRFKAAGNGIADDTSPIQKALDSLSVFMKDSFNVRPQTRYAVIYLPAGVYNISKTLRLTGKIGFSIIGEDPTKTIIRWKGPDNDTMLVANGSSYYKLSRLTWDAGQSKNTEAIGIHWLDRNGLRFAATSIEISDMIFKGGLAYGISGGTYGHDGTGANDAEVTIKRCMFYNCTGAGIAIKGYNALDYWIWNCSFTDCSRGIQCHLGNYHVYNSNFYRSTIADLDNSDGYYNSVRGCYSYNSNAFSVDQGASCNAFKRIFQNNIVNGVKSIPIQYHSQGRLTLMNNVFTRSRSKANTSISYGGWCPAIYQVLSVNNYFEDSIQVSFAQGHPTSFYSIADQHYFKKKPRSFSSPVTATAFLPFVKRKVFEIKAGAGSNEIQQAVNAAARLKGQRPVIHFPMGVFYISDPVIIPAGCDIQFTGDGIAFATIFRFAANAKGLTGFQVQGPSYCTFSSFQVDNGTHSGAESLSFINIDQPGSEIHLDQIYTNAAMAFVAEDIDFTYFEKNNSFYSTGNRLTGGSRLAKGNGTAKLCCFGGQSAKSRLANNAVMIAKDCWWEGAYKKEYLPVDLSGDGRFTLDGAMLSARDLDSTAIIRINNFKGSVTLCDMYVYGGLDVNAGNDLRLLVWNVHFFKKQNPANFIKPGFRPQVAMLGITKQCYKADSKTCQDPSIISDSDIFKNMPDEKKYLGDMTEDARLTMPRQFHDLSSQATNVLIDRVSVLGGSVAFHFQSR